MHKKAPSTSPVLHERSPSPVLSDELGRKRALSTGTTAYEHIAAGLHRNAPVLVLGLGPFPADIASCVATRCGEGRETYYIESPEFIAAMPSGWRNTIPGTWIALEPDQVTNLTKLAKLTELAAQADIILYRQGPRLFPTFWNPMIARLRMLRHGGHAATSSHTVLVPGGKDDLLAQEVTQALRDCGYRPRPVPEPNAKTTLAQMLHDERPAFFLSVNGRGLDSEGEVFHLLKECEVPVAIWMVDNPWHILSAWRQAWWKQAHIFVTDASFIPLLHSHGARRAYHLPLGMWMRPPHNHDHAHELAPVTFVGRSTFPDRQKFFSGLSIPEKLNEEAHAMLAAGERPDYTWWLEKTATTDLWPGNGARLPGFGAETFNRLRRVLFLRAATRAGLTIFGDGGWQELLGNDADIRPCVDYYGSLSSVYASARYSLNVTSLLLPAGLTQRHFDVWSVGGLLLTDNTPGLEIFPRELTAPVTLNSPSDLETTITRFERDASLYSDIKAAWSALLEKEHTLVKRIGLLIQYVNPS